MSNKSVLTGYHDAVTITINEAELADEFLGKVFKTKYRDISCSGKSWRIEWLPACDDEKGYVSIWLRVSDQTKASYTFSVDGTSVQRSETYDIGPNGCRVCFGGWRKCFSHDELRPLFRDGKLTVTCSVEFEVRQFYTDLKPSVFESFGNMPSDVELVMETGTVPVHKCFLSMISPVFHAMFSHNFAETNSSKVEITDFHYDTVKAAIDFFYGRNMENKSIRTVIGILRFADKYDIKAVTQLQDIPSMNLWVGTFCTIVQYAYDYSKAELMTECCDFFKDAEAQIYVKREKDFAKLSPQLVAHILKLAFDLKTDFDVLYYAYKNEFPVVVEHLEHRLLTSMTLNDFSAAVGYAWECSRDDLKNSCIEFWNKNKTDVTRTYETVDFCRELKDESIHTVVGILRFADQYDIKFITTQLEKHVQSNIKIETFCAIVRYAYDCSKEELLNQCYRFFKKHQKELKTVKEFAELAHPLVAHILKLSFDLKTDFDILRHAYDNKIKVDVNHLEEPYLKSMSLDNFCASVRYAWDCYRKDLKKACAKFWNNNKIEVTNLAAFHALPAETIAELLKLGFNLANSA